MVLVRTVVLLLLKVIYIVLSFLCLLEMFKWALEKLLSQKYSSLPCRSCSFCAFSPRLPPAFLRRKREARTAHSENGRGKERERKSDAQSVFLNGLNS